MENQTKPTVTIANSGTVVVPAKKPQQQVVRTDFKPEQFLTIGETVKKGLISLPKDYDVKAAMYSMYTKCISNEAGNLLEMCTPESVQEAIKKVITNAWNPEQDHCCFYPATYNDKSPLAGQKYLAVQKMAKGAVSSAYNSGNIVKNSMLAKAIFKGDDFEDRELTDGRTIIIKHTKPPFSERSNEVVGAYCVFKIIIGGKILFDAEVMTKAQIDQAWAMGKAANIENRKRFPDQFAIRTVKGRAAKRVCGWTQEQLNAFYEDSSLEIDDINNMANSTSTIIEPEQPDEVYDIDIDETDGENTENK